MRLGGRFKPAHPWFTWLHSSAGIIRVRFAGRGLLPSSQPEVRFSPCAEQAPRAYITIAVYHTIKILLRSNLPPHLTIIAQAL